MPTRQRKRRISLLPPLPRRFRHALFCNRQDFSSFFVSFFIYHAAVKVAGLSIGL
jgi:hypothetical protein